MTNIPRPQSGEYSPYTIAYIEKVPTDRPVLEHLRAQLDATKSFIASLPAEKLMHRYAPGKWTIKEILVHVIDFERIVSYRALRIARTDSTPLPGYEQDQYTPASRANERSIENILDEYEKVRLSSVALFASFDEESLRRVGTASDHPLSVRAAIYQAAGHELHHLKVIKEKYL